MAAHEEYMRRCIELAEKGSGFVAPNPMVGAVLVYNDMIIGEGYHQKYGEAHAEVNCLNAVKYEHKELIKDATLYVSLEPCAHYGKTPPCSDLIIRKNIQKVFVGCADPFDQVNGRGIEKLHIGGINVTADVLKHECIQLNKRFFTFHTQQRPYIILKWAQSTNRKIANYGSERLLISNKFSNRLVHKWRMEEAAILVGTNTVIKDDPLLTARLWPGKNPVRLVVDKTLKLIATQKVFNKEATTIIFNEIKNDAKDNVTFVKTGFNNLAQEISDYCYQSGIQSVLVEGGAKLLQTFINQGLWDEARIITNMQLNVDHGLDAPVLPFKNMYNMQMLNGDRIDVINNINPTA